MVLDGDGDACKPEEDKCKITTLSIAGEAVTGTTKVRVTATVAATGCKNGEHWWWACIWSPLHQYKNEMTIMPDLGDGSGRTYMVLMNVKYYYLRCVCVDRKKGVWVWKSTRVRSNSINWYYDDDSEQWGEDPSVPGTPGDPLPGG
jgi:hypothetical protein